MKRLSLLFVIAAAVVELSGQGARPLARDIGLSPGVFEPGSRYAYQPRLVARRDHPSGASHHGNGSCMVVVATDAPLDARDLKRLAARGLRIGADRLVVQQRQRRFRNRVFNRRGPENEIRIVHGPAARTPSHRKPPISCTIRNLTTISLFDKLPFEMKAVVIPSFQSLAGVLRLIRLGRSVRAG